jgi:hypothetical protein
MFVKQDVEIAVLRGVVRALLLRTGLADDDIRAAVKLEIKGQVGRDPRHADSLIEPLIAETRASREKVGNDSNVHAFRPPRPARDVQGKIIGAEPVDETEHFQKCGVCGEMVDRRELAQVVYHQQLDHKPRPRG